MRMCMTRQETSSICQGITDLFVFYIDFLTILGYNIPNIVRKEGNYAKTRTYERGSGKSSGILVEEYGYENLTLHKLAAKLNIKPASLYTHIKGIEELYSSLSHLALSRLRDEMLDAAAQKKQGEALRAIAFSYHSYAKQNPEMYRIILKVPHSNLENLVGAGREVKSILFEILSQYTKEKTKIIYYSRYYHSILHGFVSLETAGFFDDGFSVEKSLSDIVDDFIRQLENKQFV